MPILRKTEIFEEFVMDNGEISGFDTHENLMKSNEIYRDVYESQTKGGGDFDENGGE